jgi:hypothetical protein
MLTPAQRLGAAIVLGWCIGGLIGIGVAIIGIVR